MNNTTKWYLEQLEDQFSNRMVLPKADNLTKDPRFENTREMECYNMGISNCIQVLERVKNQLCY